MVTSQKQQKSKNIEAIYPLTPMQEGMLFHTLYAPNSGVDTEHIVLTFAGKMNTEIFKQSWQQLVQRHGALRTVFVWEGRQQPLQVVKKQVDLPWNYLDWQNISLREQQEKLEAFLKSDRNQGFQLNKAPLMRCTLIRLANKTYKLIWTFHHILIDGWCFPIILKEVLSYYQSSHQGQRCNLPPVRPYKDYIVWLQQQDLDAAEGFWRKNLQGFTTPTPLVVEKLQQQQLQNLPSYQYQQLTLGETTTNALQSFVRQYRLTPNTLVQAAWALLLNRYSEESQVLFGVTVSGRPANLSGVEEMVGMFLNTLPLGVQVSPKEQLIPWLQQLNQKQLALQEYSYSSLVEIQRLSEIPARLALFESILVFENYPFDSSSGTIIPDLQILGLDSFSQTNYPLTLLAAVTPGDFLLKISYDTSRFAADTIARILGHLQNLLEAMVTNPNIELGQLPLITEVEREQILVEWNNTITDYPTDKCIHQLFEEQVQKTPDAVAVVFEQQKLTYSQLNNKANQLAHYLQKLGVVPDTLVGICVERSVEMVVGLLAILKAGGAYVPLDPSYPSERLAYMVADAQVSVLLTQESLLTLLPESQAQIVCLDSNAHLWSDCSPGNLSSEVQPSNLGYVIYTSGSTGKPKGVAMSQGALVNLLHWQQQETIVGQGAKTLQFAPISFDVSFQEIFSTCCGGGTLVLVSSELRRDPLALMEFLTQHQVERLFLPFVALQQLASVASQCPNLPPLREVITAGEQLQVTPELVEMLKRLPKCKLQNQYGPSESHVVSAYTLEGDADNWPKLPPIGSPIANTQFYVLSSEQQPVPVGVPGELYIGGVGLANGYLKRPELTAEKFIPNPFDATKNSKLYKTGDLVRYLADGNIEFISRIDNQVKIRGYRIETGEIEATLTQHPTVKETIVVPRGDSPGDKRLVAYIVPNPNQETTPNSNPELSEIEQIGKWKQYLQQQLPEYMIPSGFVILSQLPLTPSGKVDRKALPVPEIATNYRNQEYIASRDRQELQLVKIWENLLKVHPVSVRDNFFDLGGHSLLAVRLMN
ncbi:MAG: amino acid adenylation domain-containing protein, partial [Symploca sp. SIO2D2]|nr:amino acid adenylation domain-containing protein [Symploca sp. SIO2D2]